MSLNQNYKIYIKLTQKEKMLSFEFFYGIINLNFIYNTKRKVSLLKPKIIDEKRYKKISRKDIQNKNYTKKNSKIIQKSIKKVRTVN